MGHPEPAEGFSPAGIYLNCCKIKTNPLNFLFANLYKRVVILEKRCLRNYSMMMNSGRKGKQKAVCSPPEVCGDKLSRFIKTV
jgi:hypothetical protein